MTTIAKEEIVLETNFSYEVRIYCDKCDQEVAEDEQKTHVCEDNI